MSTTGTKRRFFQLRVWHGMTAPVWLGMLRRNRFRISPSRCYLVVLISVASVLNWCLAAVQSLLLGRKIDRTELRDDPIFILGHWRSGTTLVHELLTLDERHAFPSTYACLAPSHFLVSQTLLSPFLRFLIPARRSQDNVQIGLDRPQEDEWALCSLGLPSPYLAAAFPNHLPHDAGYGSLQGIGDDQLKRWKRVWRRFLQSVACRAPEKRLVLKSPLHTARIRVLLELFPKARFVHVVRDPRAIYPSTLRLWRRLAEDEGLQVLKSDRIESFVLENFVRMYRCFEQSRQEIRPDRICQIRYEDLVADPIRELRTIYEQLNLGGFEAIQPKLETYAAEMSTFATNRFQTSAEESEKVHRIWGEFIGQFGYVADRAA
jgi:hypothetical protein